MKALPRKWILSALFAVCMILLLHAFMPHHHHYNGALCEQEAQGGACELEAEEALLRLGMGRDSQSPAISFDFQPFPAAIVLPLALLALLRLRWVVGVKVLYTPYLSFYHPARGGMVSALRAPPAI